MGNYNTLILGHASEQYAQALPDGSILLRTGKTCLFIHPEQGVFFNEGAEKKLKECVEEYESAMAAVAEDE